MSCTLFSCHGDMEDEMLVGLDSLVEYHTDSAYQLLVAMQPRVDSLGSKATSMRHLMLLTSAKNKLYMNLPSDSVFAEVVTYYDNNGTVNDRMKSRYLMGCIYRDADMVPDAIDMYKDAAECADTTSNDCDFRILSRVYGQMAHLYYWSYLPENSISAYKESVKYATLACDTFTSILSTELQIPNYALLQDTTTVLEMSDSVSKLYKASGYVQNAARTHSTAMFMYISLKDYETAKRLIEQFEQESGAFDEDGEVAETYKYFYCAKAYYYYGTGDMKNAEFYFRKFLEFGENSDGFKGLMRFYSAMHEADSACRYAEKAIVSVEKEYADIHTQAVNIQSSLFDHERAKDRIAKIRLEKRNTILVSCIIVLVCAILSTLTFIVARKIWLKRKKEIKIYKDKIRDKNRQLSDLKADIQARDSYNDMQHSSVIRKLYDKSHNFKKGISFTDDELERVVNETSVLMPNFHYHLTAKCGLSRRDVVLSILIAMGFSNKQLCCMFNLSSQYISHIKTDLNVKLFNDGTSTTLRKNLKNLIGVNSNKKTSSNKPSRQ